MNNAITTSYKKISKKAQDQINSQGKNILQNKEVIKKMFINGNQNCFITLKDHKPNFQNTPTVRLGRIIKTILDKINVNLGNSLHLNQWKNTQEVIDWFKGIDNKQHYKFIMFDIKEFYPSILKELLTDALTFAETIVNLDDHDKKIIYHSLKSLLFNQEQTWMKKGRDLFDVSMGAYDGAKVCELIGIFLLNLLGQQYDTKNIGLYRDDGLSIFKNCSGLQMEKIKKHLRKVFKNNALDVIIECNMKVVNYLGVTFNLDDGTYRPYQKPDNIIQYIHFEYNHPPNIIK